MPHYLCEPCRHCAAIGAIAIKQLLPHPGIFTSGPGMTYRMLLWAIDSVPSGNALSSQTSEGQLI
jgi:hypothetical protein